MSDDHGDSVRDDVYSKAVRAGKRTYFFDVKATRGNDLYLTITESKKRFDNDGGHSYEKHKLFLYKEDFEKFTEGLQETLERIKQMADVEPTDRLEDDFNTSDNIDTYTDVKFEDLDR